MKNTIMLSKEELQFKNKIFNIPTLDKAIVKDKFNHIDKLLWHAIELLIENTNFVEPLINKIIYKFIISDDHNKTVYIKKDNYLKIDTKICKKQHKKDFIYNVIDLLFIENKREYLEYLYDMKFLRLVFEDIIEKFLRESKKYKKLEYKFLQTKIDIMEGKITKLRELNILHTLVENQITKLNTDKDKIYYVFNKIEFLYFTYIKYKKSIIKPFLRIIFSKATKKKNYNVKVMDKFQNGYFGLLKATKTYDQSKDIPFGSYAQYWVKESMLSNMSQEGNTIQIPQIVLQQAKKEQDIDADSYFSNLVNNASTVSLNKEIDTENKKTLKDVIEDKDNSIFNFEENHNNNKVLNMVTGNWNMNEKRIIYLKSGLLDKLLSEVNISDKDKQVEIVHQLFKKNIFKK